MINLIILIQNHLPPFAPHKIFNIGNSSPINLLEFIGILENELGFKAKKLLDLYNLEMY